MGKGQRKGCTRLLHMAVRGASFKAMKKLVLISALAVGGCNSPEFQGMFGTPGGVVPAALPAAPLVETLDPTPPPPPPAAARTVEEFDTTSAADRAAAVATPVGQQQLGTTIATLGSPAEPGIWLRTGLVTELVQGRVEYQGTSVNVELRPSGGPATAGSQISLAAMRLLGAPLTGLPELVVFR